MKLKSQRWISAGLWSCHRDQHWCCLATHCRWGGPVVAGNSRSQWPRGSRVGPPDEKNWTETGLLLNTHRKQQTDTHREKYYIHIPPWLWVWIILQCAYSGDKTSIDYRKKQNMFIFLGVFNGLKIVTAQHKCVRLGFTLSLSSEGWICVSLLPFPWLTSTVQVQLRDEG